MEKEQQASCESIYCLKAGTLRCTGCEAVWYCSREHQRQNWPTHKAWCKLSAKERALTVDGYRVCDAVLKANDCVQTGLTSRHFERVDRPNDRGDIVVYSAVEEAEEPQVQEILEGEEEERPRYRLVRCAYDYGNERNAESLRAYWAYRSCASTLTLNTSVYYLLQHYASQGYKQVVFGHGLVISLSQLALRCLRLEPRVRVYMDRQPDDATEVSLICVHLGGSHTLDLSAGRFWLFDNMLRPLLVAPDCDFETRVAAALVQEYGNAKAVEALVERMLRANVETGADGASTYKLAALHLGLPPDDHNCPARFRACAIQTQQDRLASLALVSDARFQQLVDAYLQKNDSRLAQTVNVLGQCADVLAQHKGSLDEALKAASSDTACICNPPQYSEGMHVCRVCGVTHFDRVRKGCPVQGHVTEFERSLHRCEVNK
jgi:hypothetical protein